MKGHFFSRYLNFQFLFRALGTVSRQARRFQPSSQPTMSPAEGPPSCTLRLALHSEIIAVALLLFALAIGAPTPAQAQTPTFTVLHSFAGPDGAGPGGLIMDAGGNLYGTTAAGGTSSNCSGGCGTVFKLDALGNETVLHSFSGPDGASPDAGLIMDTVGNLYGTTAAGGTSSNCSGGCGTVFKLDPADNETVLHSFAGDSDGAVPVGGLVMDAAGDLYGTTDVGGTSGNCFRGCGTIFKLDPIGNETVLHNFAGGSDGALAFAALITDAAGNFYSTTYMGGSFGSGTVFKLDASGNETVLHSFSGPDGALPQAGLIIDAAGNLYGTTGEGGTSSTSSNCSFFGGCGNIFKLDPAGNETVLHNFAGGSDGVHPAAALIMDAGGNFYGTTLFGGASSTNCCGTVFKLDPTGNKTVLHDFAGGSDGIDPFAALTLDATGNLYGTTAFGGAFGRGTVFKLAAQTPQQATAAIVNSVNALFSQGVLNGGQDNSLVVQLEHAINMMNAGKNAGAIGILDSFISEVNDLLSSGVLSPSQAASLINAAQSVIARLT